MTEDRVTVSAYEYFEKEAERIKHLAFHFEQGYGSIEQAVVALLLSHAEVLSILGQLRKADEEKAAECEVHELKQATWGL